MTRCSVILPDTRSVNIECARVPCIGEEIVLDRIAAPDDGGDQWADDISGKAFVVKGVIWAAPAPGIRARVVLSTEDREKG